jgi:uncharacterized membrane protein YfcA
VVLVPFAILIGVSLGLLGGGGSILTVPLLTHVAGLAPKSAIASSLFVVAVTSAAGLVAHARAGRVHWRTGAIFGGASMAGAYAGGRVAAFVPGGVLMVLFGVMMAATGIAMLGRGRAAAPGARGPLPVARVVADGVVVGAITGLVGAGGGFLVVPALVLLGGVPMQVAIGTSLLVISLKSFAGLAGHLGHVDVAWPTTILVTAAAVGGSLVGGWLAGRVDPAALRRGFGWFVLVMAAVVLGGELAR